MLHLFLGLKSLVKVSRFHTDGSVFRLHYRLTVMVLLAFTFIVTTRQYIGSPIMCVHTKEIPKEVLNTYCWIHPTYTLSSASFTGTPGVNSTAFSGPNALAFGAETSNKFELGANYALGPGVKVTGGAILNNNSGPSNAVTGNSWSLLLGMDLRF